MKSLKDQLDKIEVPKEQSIEGQDLTNRYVILMQKYFRGDNIRRVFKCEGGFGCSPDLLGRAVMGTLIYNGSKFRSERYEIERFAKEEEAKQAEEVREKERKLLVKFKDNWSDEFDAEGFKLFNGVEWKEFKEVIEKKIQFPAKGYFGTNEFLEYVDAKDYFGRLEIVDISEEGYQLIKNLFPKGCGLFVELEV
jgi:hypothetical protein